MAFFEKARADRMIFSFIYSTFLYAKPLKSICGHLIAADGWMDLGRIVLFDFQPSPQLRGRFRPTIGRLSTGGASESLANRLIYLNG
ncbi:MAG: hypothetical protein WBH08_03860 [Methanothrix sp.]|uniref:hypothetical protein n=1 Tax=Methanothrix sp. TaxID=90426 RepID=UPI003BB5177B